MKQKRFFLKVLLITVAIFFLGVLISRSNLYNVIDTTKIQNYINSYGNWAALIFILIFTARTLVVFFPFSIMVMLGGSLFGHIRGSIFSMIAVFITATIAFFIGRLAGKDFIKKLMHGKMKELDLKIEKHGLKIIFLMRISCLFPYDILNYAAGMSKVTYKDFILGTLLGIIPETLSLSYLGSNISDPFSTKFLLAIVLVVLTMAVPFVFSKAKKKQELKD